mmetsp:Transcript_33100/g.87521  ORF Transcript_33100/g.87521 Transcript_33100/m.87521 type:complete len:236 (+) Transcript_33100:619-1326(+)
MLVVVLLLDGQRRRTTLLSDFIHLEFDLAKDLVEGGATHLDFVLEQHNPLPQCIVLVLGKLVLLCIGRPLPIICHTYQDRVQGVDTCQRQVSRLLGKNIRSQRENCRRRREYRCGQNLQEKVFPLEDDRCSPMHLECSVDGLFPHRQLFLLERQQPSPRELWAIVLFLIRDRKHLAIHCLRHPSRVRLRAYAKRAEHKQRPACNTRSARNTLPSAVVPRRPLRAARHFGRAMMLK